MVEYANEQLLNLRLCLETFINGFPLFASSFAPVVLPQNSPKVAVEMSNAATLAGTGPMAAVAGAFSEHIGRALQQEFSINEIVVENGGDIYLCLKSNIMLSIYAGDSTLSGRIGLTIPAEFTPAGICTSAGKVGPSVSFGMADAVMVACRDTALADAYATAFGNMVKTPFDISKAIEQAKECSEIHSIVIICEDKMGIYGKLELFPVKGFEGDVL
jgi:ApbE superfamily uncharacterized protein (UPF0280 family)